MYLLIQPAINVVNLKWKGVEAESSIENYSKEKNIAAQYVDSSRYASTTIVRRGQVPIHKFALKRFVNSPT